MSVARGWWAVVLIGLGLGHAQAADDHLRAVRAERTAALRDAYRAAGPGARIDARTSFARRRSSAAAALAPATLEAIVRVTAELEGALPDPARERAWLLAQALELRPRPGFFAARSAGLGEPTTVAVELLWPVDLEYDAVVELHWVDAAGERARARREPFAPSAFRAGFEMAVRPPASGAGDWWLEPTVELDGVRVRGARVLVPCIDDLEARVDAARRAFDAALDEPPDAEGAPRLAVVQRLLAGLAQRKDGGRRDALLPPPDALSLLDTWRAGEPWPRGALRPYATAWPTAEERFAEALVYEPPRPEGRSDAVVTFVLPAHAAAGGPWLGSDGERLRALARELGATIVTLRLRPGWRLMDAGVLTGLRALAPEGELTLVALGDAIGRLPGDVAARVDALVLCGYWPGAPPRIFDLDPGTPRRLVVSPLGDRAHVAWAAGDGRPGPAWFEGEREPALWTAPLFDALATWLGDR